MAGSAVRVVGEEFGRWGQGSCAWAVEAVDSKVVVECGNGSIFGLGVAN